MAEEAVKYEVLPATERAAMLSNEESIFFNVAKFEQAQRIAQMFAQSTMVPDHFRGNIGNCMIGLNYAARIGADPFMVLQTMYIVHGRPGVEAKLVEAVINNSAKYSEPLQYEWLDEDDQVTTRNAVLSMKNDEYGCQAWTKERKSGKLVIGPKITWTLVKAEGWYDKPGPDKTIKTNKWRTMPEMMFYYRAASWFANKNCPELKLGMQTREEIEDTTIDITPEPARTLRVTEEKKPEGTKIYDIKAEVKPEPQPQGENAATTAPEAKTTEKAPEPEKKRAPKPKAKETEPPKKEGPPPLVDFETGEIAGEEELDPFVKDAEKHLAELTENNKILLLKLYGLKPGAKEEEREQLKNMAPGYREAFLQKCSKALDSQNARNGK